MKRFKALKLSAAALLLILMTCLFALGASAEEKTGWHKNGSRIWYTTTTDEGETVKATGLTQIGRFTYFFNKNGYLRTGWVRNKGVLRFFRKTGRLGVKGRMYQSCQRKVNRRGFYRFEADGSVVTGLQEIGDKWYFFSTAYRKGERGLMVVNSFAATNDGRTIYLLRNGVMARNRWVKYKGKRYYLGNDGNLLRNTVTPDNWKVDGEGHRIGKANGGSTLSPSSPGTKAQTGKASILILCGHGQGDSGAVGMWNGSWIQEQAYTRDFGRRIYNALLKSGKVNVDLFNTNLDMYQQNRDILNATYVGGSRLQTRITGSGAYKESTIKALSRYSRIPDPMKYDYVLEIHFDASGVKDYGGNGSMKGVFVYVNSNKRNTRIDSKITYAIHNLGLPICGPAVWKSSGLLNARVYNEMGVSYGLLETCFIDDKDDMAFYMRRRDDMAEAVSKAIIDYFQ